MVMSVLDPAQRETLAVRGELDACGRSRASGASARTCTASGAVSTACSGSSRRLRPRSSQLGLPPRLAKFTTYHQGMVLVTGTFGLRQVVDDGRAREPDQRGAARAHPHDRGPDRVPARIEALPREPARAGHHTQSFARALRAALREDPDVIAIGELRDLETVSLALSAAETGHFVLATLHTDNAIRTVNRLVGSFPADQQDQARTMLSESLRAVISQRCCRAPTARAAWRRSRRWW
jgi:twitching motility protein PilT